MVFVRSKTENKREKAMTDFLDREGLKAVLTETKKRIEARLAHAVSKTWAELKAMRDAGTLVPGQEYRITDYAFTVKAALMDSVQSGGHPFDIIVTADAADTLSEVARAARHDGDTYFNNCKPEGWLLLYCLDNDEARFDWADTVNGKGVIYRMVDDRGNDVPYDFKNVMFQRLKIATAPQSSLVGQTLGFTGGTQPANITVQDSGSQYCYTFSAWNGNGDNSVSDISSRYSIAKDNKIAPCTENKNLSMQSGKQVLNDIVIKGQAVGNSFGACCYCISIDGNRNNTSNYANTFGAGCHHIIAGYNSYRNTIGQACSGDSFGRSCQSNSIGQTCNNNSFGDSCKQNSIGAYFLNGTFGRNCQNNTIGNGCSSITFGDYYYYNKVDDGVCNVTCSGSGDGASRNYVQNYHLVRGLNGSADDTYTLQTTTGLAYEMTIARVMTGRIEHFCVAPQS